MLPATTAQTGGANSQDDVGRKRDQFRRVFASLVGIPRGPAIVNLHVSAVGPTQLLQRLQERSDVGLRARIVRVDAALKHADAPHALALLCTRRERPRGRRADDKRDEFASLHIPSKDHALCLQGDARS